jgi:glutamine cyclotransferase
VTMRYLLFLLLMITFFGCQAPIDRSNNQLVIVPNNLPTLLPTSTSLPFTPAVTVTVTTPPSPTERLTPTVRATLTVQPLVTETSEPQLVTPVNPPSVTPESITATEQTSPFVEPIWSYRIVNEYPHDSAAYTQGLVMEENWRTLLEGTGEDTSLRRVDLQTGVVELYKDLDDMFFGEGITKFEDKIIQLTWQSQIGFVYESETFEQIGAFYYPHEGWGLTHDGSHLIVSDGTEIIRFWDPETFQEVRRIEVISVSGPLTQINELEYVNGEIWANVWHTDLIARISPEDGRVLGWIDLAGLLDPQLRPDPQAVLNGIAYDQENHRLFVTGKYWPTLFEIEVIDPLKS